MLVNVDLGFVDIFYISVYTYIIYLPHDSYDNISVIIHCLSGLGVLLPAR